MKPWLLIFPLLLAAAVAAAETFPDTGWRDRPNPLADPDAQVGGEISVYLGQYPRSLNYYLDGSTQSAQVFGALYESLLDMDPVSAEYRPGLAERWTISADKQTFTFHLDPRARWSDGRPVTARDVRFTFDTIMDPKHLTGSHKVAMERFEAPVVVDERTIRFRAQSVHWQNLGAAGGFQILPQHVLKERDFNKVNFEFPVVSGPYRLGELREGAHLTLERRPDWWLREAQRTQGTGNFQTIKFRFYAENENAFEAFKKGLIDLYPVYTARQWVNETSGPRFFNNWIVKQQVFNHKPVGFQGFGMNMRRPPFDDLRVRRAMALLLDREKLNQTMMYSQYFLHRSYFEDLYTRSAPCPNPLTPFDKHKARELLGQAGWQVDPATGWRVKDGRRFVFKFLTRSAGTDKFLAVYAEDLKDAGIELVIDQKDWAAWMKDMDGFNFDMTWAAWGAGIFKDPEGMWSSKEADRVGGSNITGFRNAAVDDLIALQKQIFDVHKRHEIVRKIDQIVFNDYPFVLLWNINYTRLLYWNKFGMPATVLSKFGGEEGAYWYWWLDPDAVAVLKDAMAHDLAVPPQPAVVVFDDVFTP
ncbi:MAG: extracellular solute-binding protein [Desulfobacterales bacterium]